MQLSTLINTVLTPNSRGGGVNLDSFFDVLNLQSNNPANFTTVTGAVSQWNDLSPSARHATQVTAGARPTYNSGTITFNGSNNFLQFTAYSASTFSVYLVIKNLDFSQLKVLMGGATVNNFISTTSPQTITINNIVTSTGGTYDFNAGGEEFYSVISIRRVGAVVTVKINGRTLFKNTTATASAAGAVHQFGYLGRGQGGLYYNGIVKACSISSTAISDAVDAQIINALFTRYNLPEISNCLVGFGDSITFGTGATVPANKWLNRLATAKVRPLKNFGIAGTVLSNQGAAVNNGQDRFPIQVIERPYSDTLCILYGTNDVSAGTTNANYQAALQSVITQALTAGYLPSQIKIGTVPYRTGDAAAATVQGFNTIITSLCLSNGLSVPADVYNQMKLVGDSCMSDSIHPNDTGHQIIANCFAAIIIP